MPYTLLGAALALAVCAPAVGAQTNCDEYAESIDHLETIVIQTRRYAEAYAVENAIVEAAAWPRTMLEIVTEETGIALQQIPSLPSAVQGIDNAVAGIQDVLDGPEAITDATLSRAYRKFGEAMIVFHDAVYNTTCP